MEARLIHVPETWGTDAEQTGRVNRHRGFTLVEILVTLAVIGVLLALLLPAVQSARQSARRVECANRLKQIGIALHAYDTAMGMLPPISDESPHAKILAYLDSVPLFHAINFDTGSFMDQANNTVEYTFLAQFLCPSDRTPDTGGIAWTNYAGNTGIGMQKYGYNGVFSESGVAIRDIGDGSSHTIAFSEFLTGKNPSHDRRRPVFKTPHMLIKPEEFDRFVEACRSLDGRSAQVMIDTRGMNWLESSLSSTLYNHSNAINGTSCTNGPAFSQGAFSSSSLHPGGVNSLFADGHVGFFKETTNLQVWRALSSRNGKEMVPRHH